jgi:hypothetical protein
VINRLDNAVRVGGPDKGSEFASLWLRLPIRGRSRLGAECAALQAAAVSEAKKVSTAFAQGQEVGVK